MKTAQIEQAGIYLFILLKYMLDLDDVLGL